MSTSASLIRPAISVESTAQHKALVFATIIVAASLFLQRFGLPAGRRQGDGQVVGPDQHLRLVRPVTSWA